MCLFVEWHMRFFKKAGAIFPDGTWGRGTHYILISHCGLFLTDNQCLVSHRSHESHKLRVASPALVGSAECLQPDGEHER